MRDYEIRISEKNENIQMIVGTIVMTVISLFACSKVLSEESAYSYRLIFSMVSIFHIVFFFTCKNILRQLSNVPLLGCFIYFLIAIFCSKFFDVYLAVNEDIITALAITFPMIWFVYNLFIAQPNVMMTEKDSKTDKSSCGKAGCSKDNSACEDKKISEDKKGEVDEIYDEKIIKKSFKKTLKKVKKKKKKKSDDIRE